MEESTSSIAVVMSTYNGAEHLDEQLKSIFEQDVASKARLSVFVRDDGSTDTTIGLLEGYERQDRIVLMRGKNIGVVGSFLEAIAAVPHDVDFIALSDQDDVWHADKLSRALEVLSEVSDDVPRLYCSEYMFCDAEMNPQARSRLNRIGVGFATMLYENMVSGNTCVMNRALADRVVAAGREGVYCHDWWIALLACAVGELHFDDFCSLEYRRTGSNASPTGTGGLALLRYRLRTFFEKGELANVTVQLARLRAVCGDELGASERALLDRMLDGSRTQKAFTPRRLRQKLPEELALRLLFLAGKL